MSIDHTSPNRLHCLLAFSFIFSFFSTVTFGRSKICHGLRAIKLLIANNRALITSGYDAYTLRTLRRRQNVTAPTQVSKAIQVKILNDVGDSLQQLFNVTTPSGFRCASKMCGPRINSFADSDPRQFADLGTAIRKLSHAY